MTPVGCRDRFHVGIPSIGNVGTVEVRVDMLLYKAWKVCNPWGTLSNRTLG